MILRLYVEKKQPFAVEAGTLLNQLNESFGGCLASVRILNRYDVENLDASYFEAAKNYVFSEPMVDMLYLESFPADSREEHFFAVEYLPGQYNQRADSAVQCLQLITRQSDCVVETAKVYVFKGKTQGSLDAALLARIKEYLINAVDSREASMDKPDTLRPVLPLPAQVAVPEGFIAWDENRLVSFYQKFGFAMSIADLRLIQAHFAKTGRDPTVTELRVLDTYWSDHCRHTTFLTRIERVDFEQCRYSEPVRLAWDSYLEARKELYNGKDVLGQKQQIKPVCLMDLATIGMKMLKAAGKLDDLDESPEINACSIRVEADVDGEKQPWLVQFKNETHNHPTEIEPFGGAATCLGGAIRDPLSGRAYVYQAVRITGAGDPRVPVSDTLPGKLPQKRLTQEAAHGFSSYGNQIGLATGHVREIYHPGFVAKRMEIGAVVGASPAENVKREEPVPGDLVLLVGGRTGRDGCGGATGSSKIHTESSIDTCGSEVQKGNPVTERKIQRLFRNPDVSRMIKRCNDFGAGGVSVAVGELADGLDINLDLVPRKYEGLDGTELAISESQERMAVVVSHEDFRRFIELCLAENLEATVIAKVTEEPSLRMTWQGKTIVDLPRRLMDTNGAAQTAQAVVEAPDDDTPFCTQGGDIKERWLALMGDLNVCSQKGLVERFDSSIGSGTVLMPFGGQSRMTPAEVSVCKLPLTGGKETNTATIMAHGYDPYISEWSPFHGAVYAVVEALAKITACGGDYRRARLSFQEYFERLGQNQKSWGKPVAGLLGAYWAQMMTGCAAIGGKDSMSGSFNKLHVPPVVTAFAMCVCDAREVISPEFKRAGSNVVLAPLRRDGNELPDFDALHDTFMEINRLIAGKRVLAAHTVGRFGIAEALAKMCFGNMLGLTLDDTTNLFGSNCGAIILEMPDASGIPEDWTVLGKTQVMQQIEAVGGQQEILLGELLNAWQSPLEAVFPTGVSQMDAIEFPEAEDSAAVKRKAPSIITAKPRVFIPVFPGTNCEYDSQRAFERAGAHVDTRVFCNLNSADIEASLTAMRAAIDQAQIMMFAGGFSAGDEPDGSAKFITAVCRNPMISDAIHGLLHRGGLILGVCNGFQALLKLGLLTSGEISEPAGDSPTLTYNTLNRHISQIAVTRVVSNDSPWLSGVMPGDLHSIPISHGEGRFIASRDTLDALHKNGQIATVYHGFNPNGSDGAVEGILSPNGRILGKMGHSERYSANTYKNIPGSFDQRIFESGVAYFSDK